MLRFTQVNKEQMLTGGLEYFHLKTPVSFVPTAAESDKLDYFAQARVWEQVIEIISRRAAPVIIGELDADGFSFAVEKRAAIDPVQLQEMLRELGTLDFDYAGTTTVDLSAVELLVQEGFRLAVSVDTSTSTTTV